MRYHDIFPTPPPQKRRFGRARGKSAPRLRRLPLIAGLVIVLAVGGVTLLRHTLRADTLTLYPTACLGGWKNPEHAQGPLSVSAADAHGYTAEQAATLPADTAAELYCGGFVADIPPKTSPKTLTLVVAWSTALADTPVISGENFASSSQQILDAPAGAQPSFQLIEPAAGGEASSAPANATQPVPSPAPDATPAPATTAPEPAPSPAPDPTLAPAADPAPVSFLDRLISIAHAQETPTAPEPAAAAAADLAPAGNPAPAPLAPPSAPPASADNSSASSTTAVPTGDFLEVRYTLNGKDWQSLGTFDSAHVVPTTFAIPLTAAPSWSDLSSFQISIVSHAALDGAPPVYLDGMELRIGYDKAEHFYSDKTLYSTTDTIHLTSFMPGSAVQIYWLDDPDTKPEASQVYAAIVGDDGTVNLEASTLFPGRFEFVNTISKWHCSNIYLIDCLSHGSLGEVILTVATPETIAAMASTTPATASSTLGIEPSGAREGTSTPPTDAGTPVTPLPSVENTDQPAPAVVPLP